MGSIPLGESNARTRGNPFLDALPQALRAERASSSDGARLPQPLPEIGDRSASSPTWLSLSMTEDCR